MLDLDGDLGCEPVGRPVEVRDEGDTVIVDMRQALLSLRDDVVGLNPVDVLHQHLAEPRSQRHDLEPAAVGKRRAGPIHECPEPTGLGDDIRTRLQVKVIGVGQDRLRAEITHGLRQHRLHRRFGSDCDECRGADIAVQGVDDTASTPSAWQIGLGSKERRLGHAAI